MLFFFHIAPNHFLPHSEAEYIFRGATVGTLITTESSGMASILSYCEKSKPNQTQLQTIKPGKVKEPEQFKGASSLLLSTRYWTSFKKYITDILMTRKQTL